MTATTSASRPLQQKDYHHRGCGMSRRNAFHFLYRTFSASDARLSFFSCATRAISRGSSVPLASSLSLYDLTMPLTRSSVALASFRDMPFSCDVASRGRARSGGQGAGAMRLTRNQARDPPVQGANHIRAFPSGPVQPFFLQALALRFECGRNSSSGGELSRLALKRGCRLRLCRITRSTD